MFPLSLEAKLIGWALATAAALGGLAWFVHHERELGASSIRQAAVEAAAKATAVAEVESARRVSAIQQEADHADQAASAARADADAARTADQRLRLRLAAAERGRAAGDPSAADPGAPASAPALVPYDVFAGVDDAAGQLGSYADQLRVSLDACIGSYRALTP